MTKLLIQIFTEEYSVCVLVGDRQKIVKELIEYTECHPKNVEEEFTGRGIAWNCYPEKHPIIGIADDKPIKEVIATLAHEASHALDYMQEQLGMNDRSGEFRAHGISTILRNTLKYIFKRKGVKL